MLSGFLGGLGSMFDKGLSSIGSLFGFGGSSDPNVVTGYSDGLGANMYKGKMSMLAPTKANIEKFPEAFSNSSNASNIISKNITGDGIVGSDMNPAEIALMKEITDAKKFQNSWFGGKGLAALGAINSLMGMYTGYKAYKDNKKNFALQREIATNNLNQSKKEYKRLEKNRNSISNSYYGRKG